ncbi:MAG: alpha/beta hydrolase [Pseudomonadota bacterium]|nr:alpha/beta hydrolase [Pseudomonadota bacterium]
MRSLRNVLAGSALALTTLLIAGCESALFSFANRGLAPPEASVTYAPELKLELDIYRPQHGDTRSAPTVVFFYGGGWQRGSRQQYQFIGRRLAQSGILTIVADYRTYPQAVFPDFIDDAARAVAWSRAHAGQYGGDPDRLFVAGHSAGAQIAALLATDPRYLKRHGLQPSALAGMIGLSGPYDFVINGQYTKVFGPPAQWPQAQAINFVDGDEPPFLLIHGADDRVVHAKDSIDIAAKLKAEGVAATLLILPDAGHSAPLLGLYDPPRSPMVLPAIERFIRESGGAKATPRAR